MSQNPTDDSFLGKVNVLLNSFLLEVDFFFYYVIRVILYIYIYDLDLSQDIVFAVSLFFHSGLHI